MKKVFVLDTNVLLHDPQAIFSFEDNDVVIPIYVIEEIDGFKKELSELGRNARQVVRYLDDLRTENKLTEGVPIGEGGQLRVAITNRDLPPEYRNSHTIDNRILATALQQQQEATDRTTVFVTKDVNLRIRADALGLRVEDYDSERTDISELYSGLAELDLTGEQIDAFYRDGRLDLSDPYYYPNQYLLLRNAANHSHTALAKFDMDKQAAVPLIHPQDTLWGIRARNREQTFATDMLMNDNVKLVTLVGKAGTGKTLLAIAAGLQKVTEEAVYQRLLISRPIFPLGRDIGFLPGDVEEKLTPWMQPIYDNVEFLMGLSRADRKRGRSHQELLDLGILEIEPLTYIRGRSIPNQFLIVDEAQNLTPHEVKTIITRAGDNTKIVLTGDPYQIDNPYVDSTNNGLVHIVNRFKTERIAAHISLFKGERSDLAELAANLL
ncbi:MAG: PhoH family protein [Myxococcota bacterium]